MVARALTQDMHVYTAYSEGKNTIAENVAEAERMGLTEIGFADHVRADSKWVPAYVSAVRKCREETPVILHCAVEAKVLDVYGGLDLPRGLSGVDSVYVASHRAPSPDGPMNPRSTRERIEAGELNSQMVLRWMVAGTTAALDRHDHVVIAHLFSALPSLGLQEGEIPPQLIDSLAFSAAQSDARILVDERRRCPTARTLRHFLRHGVPVLIGTGSRYRETVGDYDFCVGVADQMPEPELARAS